jgi:hypothetical protein
MPLLCNLCPQLQDLPSGQQLLRLQLGLLPGQSRFLHHLQHARLSGLFGAVDLRHLLTGILYVGRLLLCLPRLKLRQLHQCDILRPMRHRLRVRLRHSKVHLQGGILVSH